MYWLLLTMLTTNNTVVQLLAAWPPIEEISKCSLGMRDLQTRGHTDDGQSDGGQPLAWQVLLPVYCLLVVLRRQGLAKYLGESSRAVWQDNSTVAY